MKVIDLTTIQKLETDILFQVCDICDKYGIDYYLIGGTALGAVRHHGPIPWDDDVDIGVPFKDIERLCKALDNGLDQKYYVEYSKFNKRNHCLHPKVTAHGMDVWGVHVDIFPYIGLPDDWDEAVEHWERTYKYNAMLYIRRFGYLGIRSNQTIQMQFLRLKNFIKCLLLYPTTETSKHIIETFEGLCRKYPYETAKYVTYPCGGNGVKNFIPKKWLGEGCRVKYAGRMLKIPLEYEKFLAQLYGDYMKYPDKEEQVMDVVARVDENELIKYWMPDEIRNLRIKEK